MSELNINLSAGEKKRLLTGGKYCPDDIVVEANVRNYNLFDIDDVKIAWRANNSKRYSPKVENGVFYSGGKAGDAAGGFAYVYVNAGDVIRFSGDVSGEQGVVEVRCFAYPIEDYFDASTGMGNFNIDNTAFDKGYVIPEGCTCFGFAAYSANQYGMAFTNITIAIETSALAEQAVAYSILMGDAI